ncbi:hypothetical protein DACRYDRAFT_117329 [Dacryopinax primogenitus]|uniref:BAG domain-containing protein n=1 Tax=Dacryopinax primogenitus (strain DJM 731) TaxID=1858805 RepID=M5G367_DACPD|nr:uncharacterized protein DACRYDRAFT_117329 [Dacryopinax primogenitus]EJU00312.1 hypothetical protein DACRYDRAFT_117329 [Dacryopinax primogenitus]
MKLSKGNSTEVSRARFEAVRVLSDKLPGPDGAGSAAGKPDLAPIRSYDPSLPARSADFARFKLFRNHYCYAKAYVGITGPGLRDKSTSASVARDFPPRPMRAAPGGYFLIPAPYSLQRTKMLGPAAARPACDPHPDAIKTTGEGEQDMQENIGKRHWEMYTYYFPPTFNYGPGPVPTRGGSSDSQQESHPALTRQPSSHPHQHSHHHQPQPYVFAPAPVVHHPHAFAPPPPSPHGFPYPFGGPVPFPPGVTAVPLHQLLAQLQRGQEAQEPRETKEGLFVHDMSSDSAPEPRTELHRTSAIRRKTEDERLAEIEAERTRLLARKAEREERERQKAEAERQRAAEAAAAMEQEEERQRARRVAIANLQAKERQRRMQAEAEAAAENQEEGDGEKYKVDWPTLLGELLGLFMGEGEEAQLPLQPKPEEENKAVPVTPQPAATVPKPAAAAAAPKPAHHKSSHKAHKATASQAAAPKKVPAPPPVPKTASVLKVVPAPAPKAPVPEPQPEPVPATPATETQPEIVLHHVQLLLAAFDRLTRSFAFPRVLNFVDTPTAASALHPHLGFAAPNAPVHTYEQALIALLGELDTIPSSDNAEVRKARRELARKVEKELTWLEEEVQRAYEREKAVATPEPEAPELADIEQPGGEELASDEQVAETKAALDVFLSQDPTVEEQPNIAALEAEAMIATAEAEDDVPTISSIEPATAPASVPVTAPADVQSQEEQVIIDQPRKEKENISLEEEIHMNAPSDNYEFVQAGTAAELEKTEPMEPEIEAAAPKERTVELPTGAETEAMAAAAEAVDVPPLPGTAPAGPPVVPPAMEAPDVQIMQEQVLIDLPKKEQEISAMEEEVQMSAPNGTYEMVEPH